MKKFSVFLGVILSFIMLLSAVACQDKDDCQEESHPYTVSFQTQGGTAVAPKNTDVVVYAPTTIKENYELVGWYFDEDRTIPVQFPLSVDTNLTLYAKWKETLNSMRNRFVAAINENGGLIEKTYTSGSFSVSYTVKTIGKYIICEWDRVYTSSTDSTFTSTYSYKLSFEFGDFTTANGTVSFYQTMGNESYCSATYNFYSARVEGDTFLLNLNNTGFLDTTTLNFQSSKIEVDIQDTLLGFLNDIRSVGIEPSPSLAMYILDYNYIY